MFKKLKKRLEGDEAQPTLASKPGTAVRSSINDSSSNILVESSQDFVVISKTEQANETDNGPSDGTTADISQELSELKNTCSSCAKLEACLEKTQDTMTRRLKEQTEAFKVREEESKQSVLEKESKLEELRGVVQSLEAQIAAAAAPTEVATPTSAPQNEAYSLLTKKLISTEIDCIEAKSKLAAVEDDLRLKSAQLKEKENEISVLMRQSTNCHQQLEQVRREMTELQPLFSPTAPQDSDLWKLQLELRSSKKAEEDAKSQLEQCQQTMAQETEDLRSQCQQLAAQLTSMKQSQSRMLLEHEKMGLMVSNMSEEKANIVDSNTELANKLVVLESTHQQQLKEKNEFVAGLENSIRNLHAQVNSITKEKELMRATLESALLEKESLIILLQEDLENAVNREMTRMSGHEEAAAILPIQHSLTADNDGSNGDENMQEMHSISRRLSSPSLDLSTSFNHDRKPAMLQPIDLTEELQKLQRRVRELEDTITEKNKALRVQQQTLTDLRKQLQKEMKSKSENTSNSQRPSSPKQGDLHQIKYEYLKNTVLKYMCSNAEETQHMIKAIGTLLSFTPEEFQHVQKSIEYKLSWFQPKPDPLNVTIVK